MESKHIIQCKKVILNNKKSDKFVYLTLADKLHLMRLSRKLKKDKNIDNISFEEFVLLCKHHKISAMLRVESAYSTTFIDILKFNQYTLHSTILKALNEIELHQECNKYNNLDSIVNSMRLNSVVLFDYFAEICKILNIKVNIE